MFAGREVWPLVEGGGIGRYVWTAATLLAPHHEVTILTGDGHREAAARLRDRLPKGVDVVFAPEPEGDVRPFSGFGQAWSVALLEAVASLKPDVVEFGDYLGEGFATVHARRGGDPRLRSTAVVVRAHTSGEIVAGLNAAPESESTELTWALERFAIRHADALLWPGGDVLERYRAQYGTVAEPVRLPLPMRFEDGAAPDPPSDGPLRLLFLNRLEARKGVLELAAALHALLEAEIALTLVGRDTDTAPGGGSMAAAIEALDDPRIEIRGQVPHSEVPSLIAEHHAVAVPARWETFSYVTREALAAGRPVLATAVGAIPDVVIAGKSGWLAKSAATEDLRDALAGMDREGAQKLIAAGGPRAALEAGASSDAEQAAAYASLAARAVLPARDGAPEVDAVVALRAGDAGLDRTLRSLHTQRGVKVRVTLAAGPEALPDAARLLGADAISGSTADAIGAAGDLVMLVPAGAELDPSFAARAAAALNGFDYATSFVARGRQPWHAPLGTGDASIALARRETALRALRDGWDGMTGVVMQEPLVRRLPRR